MEALEEMDDQRNRSPNNPHNMSIAELEALIKKKKQEQLAERMRCEVPYYKANSLEVVDTYACKVFQVVLRTRKDQVITLLVSGDEITHNEALVVSLHHIRKEAAKRGMSIDLDVENCGAFPVKDKDTVLLRAQHVR